MEGMDAVVGGFLGPGAVDAAARDDDHIGIFTNIEVIIDQILKAGLADDHGNVDAFIFGAGGDDNINAGFIGFGDNIDMRGSIASGRGTVGTDIVGPDGQAIEVSDLFQQSFLDFVNHGQRTSLMGSESILHTGGAVSILRSRRGRTSSRGPHSARRPSFSRTMVSAILRIRSW